MDSVDSLERKAFFVTPPESVVTEEFLEAFFARGYEVYVVDDDKDLPLKEKINRIVSSCPGSMVFFYIDKAVPNVDWRCFVVEMQRAHGANALFGIVHDKRPSEHENKKIKDYYQQEAGVRCGCVALEKDKKADFEHFLQIFEFNGALGRRKLIRVVCDDSSSVTLRVGGMTILAKVLDVNMSHFSCDLMGKEVDFSIYDKILNATLDINGMSFNTDAVLLMKRDKGGVHTHIFMFTQPDGTPDLVGEKLYNLNHKLYQIMSWKFKIQLRSAAV